MNDYFLPVVCATVAIFCLLLIWLWYDLHKLKQNYRLLTDNLRRNSDDIAGLCSAAVELDQHLARSDEHLLNIIEQINNLSLSQLSNDTAATIEPASGYDTAIQKIRGGADVEELVKACGGMTRDEAVLLIRLHGGK